MFSKQAVVLVKNGVPRHVTKGEVAICFKDGVLTVVDHTGAESQVLTENVAFGASVEFEGGGAISGNAVLFFDGTYEFIIDLPVLSASRQVYWGDAAGVVPIVPQYADLTAANADMNAGDFYWDLSLLKLMVATG